LLKLTDSQFVEKSVAVGELWYLTQRINVMVDLYSCIASNSQTFFKRVFYLEQTNSVTGTLLQRGPGQLTPLPPPVNPALTLESTGLDQLT